MTEASRKTYATWDVPKASGVQKEILSFIAEGKASCHTIYAACRLGHATGSARLQELQDMGLVHVAGTQERKVKGRASVLSLFALTRLGGWLMDHDSKDDVLRKMNRARRIAETQRADQMFHIRREYQQAAKGAVVAVAEMEGYA